MDIRPADIPPREVYKLMIGAIVPRAIAWVSTISADGQPNLAPFSFFTAVCQAPPTLLFCPGVRGTDGSPKDTLNNIRTTGEFAVNFVTEELAEAMNVTATEVPAHVDEFERAGLTAAPARVVRAPVVAESPIHFECRLQQIVTVSDAPGGGYVVLGEVVHIHVDDRVYRAGNYIDLDAYRPIGRLAGAGYSRVTDTFEMARLPPEITKKN